MKKILKLSIQVILIFALLKCNGQEKHQENINQENSVKSPDFSDKKYFRRYELDANNAYPKYFYRDNKVGEFSVIFLAKDIHLQKQWQNFDIKNGIVIEDGATEKQVQQINMLIKEKLEPSIKNYYTIVEYVSPKYLNVKHLNYIYPYKRTYYLYIEETKSWSFLKDKIITDGSDEKNITKLNELNEMMNFKHYITKKDSIKSQTSPQKLGNYSDDGNWRTDCNTGMTSFNISGKNGFLVVAANQIYIDLVETKRYDFEKGIAYKLEKIPEDMGRGGMGLNWQEYINDKPIVYVKKIDDNHMYFYWYGFYNGKTKKREFLESDFNVENKSKDIILTKCE